tara:strand:+ start:1871 stop:2269 length:399 start_codon:yes stop_codon:yes gene_type:complete
MSIKIDQAFIQSFIDGAFSLPINYENMPYTPIAGTAYATLTNLPNQIDSLSLSDMNETSGIFRIILRYPTDGGAIAPKTKSEQIMAYYPIGSSVAYSGQSATIRSVNRQAGIVEDAWYTIVVSIRYISFITR